MAHVLIEGPLPQTFQVEPVQLDKDEEKDRVGSLVEEIQATLRDRSETEEKIWKVGVKQYHAALKREDAEPGESELDLPSTREFVDMAAARLINTVFARPEVWVSKPRRPEARDFATAVEQFMDWATDRTQFRFFVEDVIKNALVFPKAVAKVPYIQRIRKIRDYQYKEGDLEAHWGAKKDAELTIGVRDFVEENRPLPEVVPIADFIHPIPCASIDEAPWICHRVWLSLDQIKDKIRREIYREKDPEGEEIAKKITESEDSKPDQELSLAIGEKNAKYGSKLIEVWEVYTCYDGEETILTLLPETSLVLRWIYNFYFDYQRPFATFCYERVPGDIDGISLCYMLEPLHRLRSACFNQRVDAASRAMENAFFLEESLDAGKYFKDGKIRSGVFMVNSAGDINQKIAKFEMSQPFSPIEGIEATAERDMQKVASLTDYNAGMEQIQRPTASGQIALLEEGRQPMYSRMENLREFLKRVGMMMLARYRQFQPYDIEVWLQTRSPKDQQLTQVILSWPEQYWRDEIILETAVSSQSMNRDLRKQEWLALVDKMPAVFNQLMQMIQMAMDPSPMAPVAAKMLTWYMRYAIQPWLQEFEVGGAEFLDFSEEMNVGQMFAEMAQQLGQQIEGLTGDVEQSQLALEEVRALLDHVSRAYVNATGRVPPPPPASFGRNRLAQEAGGVGGGPALPGGPAPGANPGVLPGAAGEVA